MGVFHRFGFSVFAVHVSFEDLVEKWFETLLAYGHDPKSGDFGELVYRIVHIQPHEVEFLRDTLWQLQSMVQACDRTGTLDTQDAASVHSPCDSDAAHSMDNAHREFIDLCFHRPWVVESALAVCGAALISASDPGRVVGYYPAHTLHYVIRLVATEGVADRGPATDRARAREASAELAGCTQETLAAHFLQALGRRTGKKLTEFRETLGSVSPGFGDHVAWPTVETCLKLEGLADELDRHSDAAMAEGVALYRQSIAAQQLPKKIPADIARRLRRMQYCFRDLSVVCRLLAQPSGWLRLLLYSKLCVLNSMSVHVQRQPTHEVRAKLGTEEMFRRRVGEIAYAVLWELGPPLRLAANSPFHGGDPVHCLFADPDRKGTLASRKRLQRGRERLLFSCSWQDRNGILEPNSILDGRDDGLLDDLRQIRHKLWGAPP